eukprot:NODE_82_length_22625_cov_0.476516.p9 type:complete len:221 gc:universal NODE_82_length_22625_cov_0.476516:21991-21329(-)
MSSVTHNQTPGLFYDNPSATTGIVLIQEWWGVDDNMKEYGQKYSKNYKVVIPDLYRNRVTQDKDEAHHLMDGMDFGNAVNDIKNLGEYLKSKGCSKIGVIGYCMGGALTIAAAVKLPNLFSSGVCFYGIPPKQYFDYTTLKIPMQFHFGKKDSQKGFSDQPAYSKLKSELENVNFKTDEFYEYDANHAFMNTHATAYPFEPECAKLAEERMHSFFKKTLQ